MFLRKVAKLSLQKRGSKVNAYKTVQEYDKTTASTISHTFEDVTNGPSIFDNK
jgi:hypothetical protein